MLIHTTNTCITGDGLLLFIVTAVNTGQFSCEIEDFGEVENKSVTVELMPLPQVEIKPLTASLLKGQSVSLRCLSPDENMRTFFYQVSRGFTARVVLG